MSLIFSVDEMGTETVAAAKKIISRRVKMQSKLDLGPEPDFAAVINRMEKIEDKLATLEKFEAKLDLLLRKLT